VLRGAKPQHAELIFERLKVLLDAELDDLRAVADGAEVGVDPADLLLGAVAEFPAHRVKAHRSPAVKRLKPGSRPSVTEDAGAELASLPSSPNTDAIEQLAHVNQHRLSAGS
jgi:hypothetical protein